MACERCPIQFQGQSEIGMVRPGQARVRILPDCGLIMAFFASDASHVGVGEMDAEALAADHPELAAGILTCPEPITAAEAHALGNPAVAGACRPLYTEVGDYLDADVVETKFGPPEAPEI